MNWRSNIEAVNIQNKILLNRNSKSKGTTDIFSGGEIILCSYRSHMNKVKTKKTSFIISLLSLRVRSNELNSKIDRADLVCLIIRYLKPKFFFKGHDNLHSVQTI